MDIVNFFQVKTLMQTNAETTAHVASAVAKREAGRMSASLPQAAVFSG